MNECKGCHRPLHGNDYVDTRQSCLRWSIARVLRSAAAREPAISAAQLESHHDVRRPQMSWVASTAVAIVLSLFLRETEACNSSIGKAWRHEAKIPYQRINSHSAKRQISAAAIVRLREDNLPMNAVWAKARADSAPQCENCCVAAEDLMPTCPHCPSGKAPRG